jgi:hypothetical protein
MMTTSNAHHALQNLASLFNTAASALPDQGTLTTLLNTTVEPSSVALLSALWLIVVFLIARHIKNQNIRDGIELPRSKQKQISKRYLHGRW